MIAFDGLDEVPASANRAALMIAINDFLSQARQEDADLFVLATSRQIGYVGEFSSGYVATRYVAPLSTPRALQYVEKYATARFGATDPNKAADLVRVLQESAERPLTAQLMSSPLQVTFMATVVGARGNPGQDRWQLFDGYYRTIYDRETQKAVPPYDAVLSKQQATIDRLHHDIGFWLQYVGETSGESGVSLTFTAFSALVDGYLTEVGREGSDKADLVAQITNAARERLVFLTSRVEGELSFDVRSLQEYMAADCLMTGEQHTVRKRLEAIGSVPYWRNVFVFAASKCFADTRSRHLQDTIRLLCADFNNETDPVLKATRCGSELALDILQSGALAENPHYGRHFCRLALELAIDADDGAIRPEASFARRLGQVFQEALGAPFRELLTLHVGQTAHQRTLGAWAVLVQLYEQGVPWAIELADAEWDARQSHEQRAIFEHALVEDTTSEWALARADRFLAQLPPFEAVRLGWERIGASKLPFTVRWITSSRQFSLRLVDSNLTADVRLKPVGGDDEPPVLPSDWDGLSGSVLATIAAFVMSPTPGSLSEVIRAWGPTMTSTRVDPELVAVLPWPVAGALSSIATDADVESLATAAAAGALGDSREWVAHESQWLRAGAVVDSNGELEVDEVGRASWVEILFPWAGTEVTSLVPHSYVRIRLPRRFDVARREVWQFLRSIAASNGPNDDLTPGALKELIQKTEWEWRSNVVPLPAEDPGEAWLDFFDWLGRSSNLGQLDAGQNDEAWQPVWETAYVHQPHRVGLLRLLGRLAASGLEVRPMMHAVANSPAFEPSYRLAAVLIELSQADLTAERADELASIAVPLLSPPAEAVAENLLMRAVQTAAERGLPIVPFLLRLRESAPTSSPYLAANCASLLKQIRSRWPSRLHQPGVLAALKLPALLVPE